ncbi:lysylphosphatidylglycerol synthase domain-containing protein [Nocardioides sp. YIM 152588]|uniref:lysylphosphatidylglycerol synthase domain-containing protein n=1 Tax=Nocardioides sp. YIM 152588 TaxID=3158259 RepID=UPI0032E48E1C
MRRAHALLGARIGFVLLTIGFAWWGFRGRWAEIGEAITGTSAWQPAVALVATASGLLLTGALWRRLLAALGYRVSRPDAASVFFVGQVGKYLPGSVWSFAAQAQLGRRYAVPMRTSFTASALFLFLHTASGLVLGGALAAAGVVDLDAARWWWLAAIAVGVVSMSPPLVRVLGDRLAGRAGGTAFGARALLTSCALMAGVWACFGAATWALAGPGHGVAPASAVGAFAIAHVAGVLLVFAPAGLGAREAVLVAALAPALGVGAAAAVALLARVVHTVADFLLATASAARVGLRTRRGADAERVLASPSQDGPAAADA